MSTSVTHASPVELHPQPSGVEAEAEALVRQAYRYFYGEGVTPDDDKYVELMTEAVHKGHPTAMDSLHNFFMEFDRYQELIDLLAKVAKLDVADESLLSEQALDARYDLLSLWEKAEHYGLALGNQDSLAAIIARLDNPNAEIRTPSRPTADILRDPGERRPIPFYEAAREVGHTENFIRLAEQHRFGTGAGGSKDPLTAARCYANAGALDENIPEGDERLRAKEGLLALWNEVKDMKKLVTLPVIRRLADPILPVVVGFPVRAAAQAKS